MSSQDPYSFSSRPSHLSSSHKPRISLNDAPGRPDSMDASDFSGMPANPTATSPLAQSFQESRRSSYGASQYDVYDDRAPAIRRQEDLGLQRTSSSTSIGNTGGTPSRSNTLKKQKSLSRKTSLKRSGSRRSLKAGSIKGLPSDDHNAVDRNSIFHTPIPTSGSPTEILANRFQAWRKLLKDLIAYFRDVQASYENRSKALAKVSNSINTLLPPEIFMAEGGLNDANHILRDYHKQAVVENLKARDIENDIISQLNGLRSDLGQKIKEIKSLSGDFKNAVDKEKEGTRKAVGALQEALAAVEADAHATAGKDDPYIVRLTVERQAERQIDEENYLHRAYLNMESSGRELESIVVGEIQKAYNAYATILKKEADEAYETVERLRSGPVTVPKDLEWTQFIENDPRLVNPNTPVRKIEDLEYPGKFHPAAAEVRAGMLERKSKYLKSYTAGWYILSSTHLHEFKSADGLYTQSPVMSLYLPDQKLGAKSQPDSSSHKFMLKGRQTGTMHRGHSWVFRAESYDTMLAWYDDIKSLTEKTGEDRNNFVRRHTRSFSRNSAGSASSLEEDEADMVPYSASHHSLTNGDIANQTEVASQRPQPGGRFPSDVQDRKNLPDHLSASSNSSFDQDLSTVAKIAPGLPSSSRAREMQPMENHDTPSAPPLWTPESLSHHESRIMSGIDHPLDESSAQESWNVESRHHDPQNEKFLVTTGLAATMATPEHHHLVDEHPADSRFTQAQSTAPTSRFNSTFHEPTPPIPHSQPESQPLPTETLDSVAISTRTGQSTGQILDSKSRSNVEEAPLPNQLPRRNTDNSVSNLHIPGEYPQGVPF